MPEPDINQGDLELIVTAAREAGEIAMGFFRQDPKVWFKPGDSPVTEADMAIDTHLKKRLLEARPDYGWLSEESPDDPARLNCKRIFVVDPIDGTRGFIKGMERWCISIAVVEAARPVVGVLECSALNETFTAFAGGGATLNQHILMLGDESGGANKLRVAGPNSLIDKIPADAGFEFDPLPFIPSLAYRLAMVASQQADVTFARPNAQDWDIAAVDLIVHEAGGILSGKNATAPNYNQTSTRHGLLIASQKSIHDDMVEIANAAADKL